MVDHEKSSLATPTFSESPVLIESAPPELRRATPDAQEIRRALELIWPDRSRFELRLIHNAVDAKGRRRVDGGLFDAEHISGFVSAAIEGNKYAAVYVNLNPIKPEYVSKSPNKVKSFASGLVGNDDISHREYFFIDLDPVRTTNTSATEAQLAEALRVAEKVAAYLAANGWPEPIRCASGNGVHLLYRIDLPNDEESLKLTMGVLEKLSGRLNNEQVKIDKAVSNAGRIIKLYGTVANKGPDSAEAPHRLSHLINVPTPLVSVSKEQLAQEAAIGPLGVRPPHLPPQRAAQQTAGIGTTFDLIGFLTRLGIPFELKKKPSGTESYGLQHCPFNPAHGVGDSGVSRESDGRLGFKCFHDSCADKNWHSLRALVVGAEGGAQDAALSAGLPTPVALPNPLRPVKALDSELLPASIRAGLVDIADRLGCPLDYVAVPLIVAAGVVLGNKVGIYPKQFDEEWIVFAVFWGGIVGNPGSMKTPALQASLKPLALLEKSASEDYAKAIEKYKVDKQHFDAAISRSPPDTTQPIPPEPVVPVKKRYTVNDTTYQALGEILANNPQGVLALSDELSGLLQSLDTPGQEAARGFYLSGWGGNGNYTFDRIGRGHLVLHRYAIAVFGGFQPDRIKSYVKAAQGGNTKNDGLLQRFQLLVWPDLPDETSLVDRAANKAAIVAMTTAVLALKALTIDGVIGARRVQDGPQRMQVLHFDEEAQQGFNQWLMKNEAMLRKGADNPAEHSHFAKYRSLVPGLALLFHLLEGHVGDVCGDCLARAIGVAAYLKSHAKRVYASVHGYDAAPARALAKRLLDKTLPDGFTARSIRVKGWRDLSEAEQVKAALDVLVEHGWLVEQAEDKAGRKTVRYSINPTITKDLLAT